MIGKLQFKLQNAAPQSSRNAKKENRLSPAAGGESINDELKEHALSIGDWRYREAVATLHDWAKRFNKEFRLDLDIPAIAVDSLQIRVLGQYRVGRNGLGVRHEITLNARHLTRPLAEQLATLLHELLHEWQSLYGRPAKTSYHNQQFRIMAKKFGLIINERGHHIGVIPGPFTRLLAQCNVGLETLRLAEEEPVLLSRPRGTSKLKKWRCGCTNVRCAVELRAKCFKCGMEFELSV